LTTCAVCQAKSDGNLCKPCTSELERAIAELPADLTDLELVATRQAVGPLGLGVGRQWTGPFEDEALGDAPWEFAPAAADQIWVIGNTVTTWARHLAETHRLPLPRLRTVRPAGLRIHRNRMYVTVETREIRSISPVTSWLRANLNVIRYDEAAAQIHEELVGLHAENEQWILGRRGVELFAGNCDATQVSFEQRPQLYVERNRMHIDPNGPLVPVAAYCGVPLYGRDGETDVRCKACGTRYPLQPRLDEIRDQHINDQLARAHTIADALTTLEEPMGRDLLRKWIQRDALRTPRRTGPRASPASTRPAARSATPRSSPRTSTTKGIRCTGSATSAAGCKRCRSSAALGSAHDRPGGVSSRPYRRGRSRSAGQWPA
jgi:uncharacterized Zn finger protein (UPF0148 family)